MIDPEASELNEDYQWAAQELEETKRLRDQFAENLKSLAPENRPEAEAMLAQMNREIEQIERALAAELTEFETYRQAREELKNYLASLPEYKLRAFRDYLRQNPGTMLEVEEVLFGEFDEPGD